MLTKEFILSKCDYFVDVQLWPLKSNISTELWLSNFQDDEMEHAVHLLNSFLYFSDQLVNTMFAAGFQMLSNIIRKKGDSLLTARTNWSSFFDNLVITTVTGEIPNISDSGYSFARKARQLLGVDESRLMSQEDCIKLLIDKGHRPVIFVDDFIGSGNQFIETWNRKISVSNSSMVSYKDLSSMHGSRFYYCPVICTEYGYNRILRACPEVVLFPVHVLSQRYCALANDSIVWPDHLRKTAKKFLETASKRAGISDWQGFHRLGLAIAFEHGVPDATLPIFYWEDNGWKPLVKGT